MTATAASRAEVYTNPDMAYAELLACVELAKDCLDEVPAQLAELIRKHGAACSIETRGRDLSLVFAELETIGNKPLLQLLRDISED